MSNHKLTYESDWETLARDADYSPRELAKLCKISVRTLERRFRTRYGLKVGLWIRNLRLRDGYEALLRARTIKEAAYNSGFKQASHFSREFKKSHGVSPNSIKTNSDYGLRSTQLHLNF